VRLVEDWQHVGRGTEQRDLAIALTHLMERGAESGDGLVVRVEQSSLHEERVQERVPHRPFDHLPEFGTRDEDRVDVHTIGVE
jgi:hypothetical protein